MALGHRRRRHLLGPTLTASLGPCLTPIVVRKWQKQPLNNNNSMGFMKLKR